jgi:hypothetical protein
MEQGYVVVLSTFGGRQMLSHASLMNAEEAEHEASVWRQTVAAHLPTGPVLWAADVRKVQ